VCAAEEKLKLECELQHTDNGTHTKRGPAFPCAISTTLKPPRVKGISSTLVTVTPPRVSAALTIAATDTSVTRFNTKRGLSSGHENADPGGFRAYRGAASLDMGVG